jgi:hypothetical protein
VCDYGSWRVAFCSLLKDGLTDIPSEMQALHAYFAQNGIRGGWRKVGSVLGVSGAYARELAYKTKPLNHEVIVKWLSFTGRYRQMVVSKPCPSCLAQGRGAVIHGEGVDCHGKPVARVVIVSGKPRNRKRYHRPCLDDAEYARYLEWRRSA